MVRLSIIIPIYNGSSHLKGLVRTIKAFTFLDFECIFIDNNSTDGSIIMLKKLLEEASFKYTILSERRQGAGYARNWGIKHAKGEFLAFLDCDDIIFPQKFEYDISILENNPNIDFIFCRTERIYEDGTVLKHPITGISEGINVPPQLGITWLSHYFRLQGTCSLVAKKRVIENLGGFYSTKTGEDAFLFIRLGLIYNGYFYDKVYCKYLRHTDSTISVSNQGKFTALNRYFELRQNLFFDKIVRSIPAAFDIVKEQLRVDFLRFQHLKIDPKEFTDKKLLKELNFPILIFNPLSLALNRLVPNLKYSPSFQIQNRILRRKLRKLY